MPRRRDPNNTARNFCNAAHLKRSRRNELVEFAQPHIVPAGIVDELAIIDETITIVPKSIICTVHDERRNETFQMHVPIEAAANGD